MLTAGRCWRRRGPRNAWWRGHSWKADEDKDAAKQKELLLPHSGRRKRCHVTHCYVALVQKWCLRVLLVLFSNNKCNDAGRWESWCKGRTLTNTVPASSGVQVSTLNHIALQSHCKFESLFVLITTLEWCRDKAVLDRKYRMCRRTIWFARSL